MSQTQLDLSQARYLKVSAAVRYWEDASVNGVDDVDGTRIPFRTGDIWLPIIDLVEGRLLDWPDGVEARIHYKVCDAGEYWLLDANRQRIAKWKGYYVPDDYLCVGDSGHGDYIIFKVGADGVIPGWRNPGDDPEQWVPV
ncbi:hypothetical protein WJ97_11860 [Burkholderia ubonensis]|uniref:hypothetical protein n=1 Tax=Burkholderia ubonensis TaxID=101571 RepID=UPI00075BEB86|nr:hypothetical protein [Burkholderia ubonensis]KVP96575.1 hypothetical protein WJ97_11860 [Burkholderia ubonensis]